MNNEEGDRVCGYLGTYLGIKLTGTSTQNAQPVHFFDIISLDLVPESQTQNTDRYLWLLYQ